MRKRKPVLISLLKRLFGREVIEVRHLIMRATRGHCGQCGHCGSSACGGCEPVDADKR
jgi:hypothetical protein